MKKSDLLTLTIESLAHQGDGVAHHLGKKVFVPYAVPGDEVQVRVNKQTSQHIHATLETVLNPSESRITPACKHFTQCGGCALQHLDGVTYHSLKMEGLLQPMQRAGLDVSVIKPLVEIGAHSRRRTVLHVKAHGKRVKFGYYQAGTHHIVDIKECPILDKTLFALVPALRKLIISLDSKADITEMSLYAGETGVAVLVEYKSSTMPELADLERYTAFAHAHAINTIAYQNRDGIIPVIEKSPVVLYAGDVEIALPAGTFQQATKKGQQVITEVIQSAVGSESPVLDIYSGCGAYSFAVVNQTMVHAVEGSKPMVDTIKRTAARHDLHGRISAEQRDLVRQPLLPKALNAYKAIIINPPRNGAKAQVEQIAKSKVPVIVMASCNPKTFSSDAKLLIEGGYRLDSVLPIDQFVWSTHLELVAVFRLCE